MSQSPIQAVQAWSRPDRNTDKELPADFPCHIGNVFVLHCEQNTMDFKASFERCIFLIRWQIRCSIVVSISACHAEDRGSIPGGGVFLIFATIKIWYFYTFDLPHHCFASKVVIMLVGCWYHVTVIRTIHSIFVRWIHDQWPKGRKNVVASSKLEGQSKYGPTRAWTADLTVIGCTL